MLPSTPFEVLTNLVRSNPSASYKEVFDNFEAELAKRPAMKTTLLEYWFKNHWRVLEIIRTEHTTAVLRKHRQAKRAAKDKKTRAGAQIKLQLCLMDHMLSNGKLLRNATFADCEREGGWLKEVAKRGKPTQVVGYVLKEVDLQNLRGRNMPKAA